MSQRYIDKLIEYPEEFKRFFKLAEATQNTDSLTPPFLSLTVFSRRHVHLRED